jgi:hypothetical protein
MAVTSFLPSRHTVREINPLVTSAMPLTKF